MSRPDSQSDDQSRSDAAEAVAALYKRYADDLRWFVFGVLRDHEAAADVVQATFAKAVESIDRVQPEAVKSWLYRVAYHEALTWRRRSGTDQKARQQLGSVSPDKVGGGPDEPLIQEEIVEQVRRAIEALPPAQQQVVRARVYERKTFAQIASERSAPLGTVLTQMRRALAKLRDILESHE